MVVNSPDTYEAKMLRPVCRVHSNVRPSPCYLQPVRREGARASQPYYVNHLALEKATRNRVYPQTYRQCLVPLPHGSPA